MNDLSINNRLKDWQVQDLLSETDEKGVLKWPVRALRWTFWLMPKSYRDENGEMVWIDASDRFWWLRQHRSDYFQFLKDHKLEKEVYDKYIGTFEKEERTKW